MKKISKITKYIVSFCLVITTCILCLIGCGKAKSPKEQFDDAITKAYEETEQKTLATYDTTLATYDTISSENMSVGVDIKLGEMMKNLISYKFLNGADLSWLDIVGVVVDTAVADGVLTANTQFVVNGTDITSLTMTVDTNEMKTYVTSKLLKEGTIVKAPFTWTGNVPMSVLATEKWIPKKEQIESVLQKVLKSVLSEIKEVGIAKDKQTITAEGVSEECTVLTAELDKNVLSNIKTSVADIIEKDKDMTEIFTGIQNVFGNLEQDSNTDNLQTKIAKEIRSRETNINSLSVTLYIGKEGRISGIDIVPEGEESDLVSFLIRCPKDGEKLGLEAKAQNKDAEEQYIALNGSAVEKNGKLTGAYTLKFKAPEFKEETWTISMKDFSVSKDGMINGTIAIPAELSDSESKIYIILDFGMKNKDSGSVRARVQDSIAEGDVNITAKELGEIKITWKKGSSVRAQIPEGDIVEFNIGSTMETIPSDLINWDSIQELSDKLETAGVPKDIATVIKEYAIQQNENPLEDPSVIVTPDIDIGESPIGPIFTVTPTETPDDPDIDDIYPTNIPQSTLNREEVFDKIHIGTGWELSDSRVESVYNALCKAGLQKVSFVIDTNGSKSGDLSVSNGEGGWYGVFLKNNYAYKVIDQMTLHGLWWDFENIPSVSPTDTPENINHQTDTPTTSTTLTSESIEKLCVATGWEADSRQMNSLLSMLNLLSMKDISLAYMYEDANGDDVLCVRSSDNKQRFDIYFSPNGSVEAIQDANTFEWIVKSNM